jgi:2-amino-4-hydroxy-6-hydroxymethyldihydropteridine diphosphokinase
LLPAGATRVYIGIGSNLGVPQQQLDSALAALSSLDSAHLIACSGLYRGPALGLAPQPDYVNAVAALACGLEPLVLLDRLQAIEDDHGRVRTGERWAPRTLDLDILLFGECRLDTPRLVVPHPEMARRAFVLVPLAELAPDLEVPGLGAVADLAAVLLPSGLRRFAGAPVAPARPPGLAS